MTRIQEVIEELHGLDQKLACFEHQYGILSETFFAWYQSGEDPESLDWVQDFALWAGAYQLKLRRQEKYRRLISDIVAQRGLPAMIHESVLAGLPG